MEKIDLKLLKNEIVVLNLSANNNIFANIYQSSIYNVAEVAVKKENSIFVEGFQELKDLKVIEPEFEVLTKKIDLMK